MNRPPIFVVGSPRSGTNLLRRMLDRHPAIAICGETHFFSTVYPQRRREAFGDPADARNRQRLVDALVSTRRIQALGLDSAQLAKKLMQDGASYPALFAALCKCYSESQGKPRWGEKTPQHAFFTETLCEWYPGAVILHMVRDPRDVVSSLLRLPFGFASTILNARTWLNCNLAARRSKHRQGYLEVRYESLAAQPKQELERICTFIGEEYCPAMLEAEQASIRDALESDRYLAPLTTERLERWRKELSTDQVAQVEWWIGAELKNFGYEAAAPPASAVTIAQGLVKAALELAREVIPKLPALWYYYMAPANLRQYEYWRHPFLRDYVNPEVTALRQSARPGGAHPESTRGGSIG
jgi:hypothetical protein